MNKSKQVNKANGIQQETTQTNKASGIQQETKHANKINGILLDAGYTSPEGNDSIIMLFIKTKKGIESVYDREFRPYLYAKTNDFEKAVNEINSMKLEEGHKILKTEKAEKENEKNLVKITFNSTMALSRTREMLAELSSITEITESDILYPKRYLLDKNLTLLNKIEIETEEENEEIKKEKEAKEKENKSKEEKENSRKELKENKGREEKESNENENKSDEKKIKWIKSIKETELIDSLSELNLAAFDLETYSGKGFSNPEHDPILMISVSTGKKSLCMTYKKEFQKVKNTKVLKNEKEMIEFFIKYLNELKPDVLITYNGDGFDFPYLRERAKQLKVKLEMGFEGTEPTTKRISIFTAEKLKGVQHLDAFQMTKFLVAIAAINSPRLDLESVITAVFGVKKEKVHAKEINEIWETGKKIEKLVKYNNEDSEYTVKLAERFLPLIIEIGKLTKQSIFDASRASSSQNVENLLMQESIKRNELIPNKPREGEVTKRRLSPIKGGYVKEPIPGLHENIAVLDFRSLYPSIIISHNVSPETFNCGHGKCMNGKNISPEGHYFCGEKKGLMPEALEKILNKRIEIKKELKNEKNEEKRKVLDARQHALKILLNSSYGTLIFPRFRWYCRECGKSITAWARKYIQNVLEEAEKQGFIPLYSDTDSSFLILPKNKAKKDVLEFVEFINSKLPGAMELEFEGFFKRGIFVTKKEGGAAKKRYALIDFENRIKIVGFEAVRRDWSKIAKKTQSKALEMILKEGNPKKAIELVKKTIKDLREGNVSKEDLIILTKLTKPISKYENTSPHLEAAKKAIQKGKAISQGTMIDFIITSKGKSISEKSEMSEFVQEGDYDKDYYIEHQIIPSVQRILEELGYSKQDLLIGGKQKTLFSFK
ncbi:MAG: DNA-directed DNA polymerase [Candidatus Diapherotrites archaeon]